MRVAGAIGGRCPPCCGDRGPAYNKKGQLTKAYCLLSKLGWDNQIYQGQAAVRTGWNSRKPARSGRKKRCARDPSS